MADIKLIFKGAKESGTEKNELEVFANISEKISICLFDSTFNYKEYPNVIQLDRATAIKFHRELKKQISFLESEGIDG
jgi:hypothetical protein